MKCTPLVVEQAPVGDFLSERVLEAVLEVGEQLHRGEKLRGLKVRENAAKRVLRQPTDRLEERKRHILPNDRGGLEQTLVLGRQAIDAGGEDGLRRRRDLPRMR